MINREKQDERTAYEELAITGLCEAKRAMEWPNMKVRRLPKPTMSVEDAKKAMEDFEKSHGKEWVREMLNKYYERWWM